MTNHTPTPWKIKSVEKYSGTFQELAIEGPDGQTIIGGCGCCGSPFGDNPNDPEFIVRAANAHDDLIYALKFYMSICGNTCGAPITRETAQQMYAMGESAINKAEGK